jgi:septum formation protein
VSFLDLNGRRLILASASPRRAELLRSVGLEFEVMPADIDESARPGELPSDYVARLSQEKAEVITEMIAEMTAGRLDDRAVIVAADTTVDVDGQILEKPVDDDDARRMLRLLSGRVHLVHTGVTVLSLSSGSASGSGLPASRTQVVETGVRFVELTDHTIDWYLATGEHLGKAGAYGIQGAAGAFVERIDGSVTNVIGLPLAETTALLGRSWWRGD